MKFNSFFKKGSVKNHEGDKAYAMTPELELYSAVVTASLSNTFYEKQDDRIERIAELVRKLSPEFVARLAVYTRTEMHLRSIPLLLLVELAKVHNGDDLVARAVEKTVLRADEIMELLTCYQWRNTKSGSVKKLGHLSRQIQNGLKRAFNRFDEYQFAKYNRNNLEVKLRDALFLVHPKAKDDNQQAIFDKIVNGTLETPYTWETELSEVGKMHYDSTPEKYAAFALKWGELINSGKLGYMAMMRNLRNMLQYGVAENDMQKVANRIADKHEVENSKQLPFRYMSAFREIAKISFLSTTALMNALEKAVMYSAANIEGFDENTRVLLASDVSGSMYQAISTRSTLLCYDIGLLLSMLMKSRCKRVVAGVFGDIWKVVNLPSDSILMATDQMKSLANQVGYSTNGYKVIDWLIDNKVVMDKVMMFTDMQMWDTNGSDNAFAQSWKAYKKMAPNARLYLFDLVGYGQAPLRIVKPDVYLIAGWSDRIFSVLSAIDKGADAVAIINKVEV